MKKLTELKIGQIGIIQSFENDEIFLKLMEMGCLPGEEIEIENVALSGDPISVYVSGYNLSLRKQEAATILVKIK